MLVIDASFLIAVFVEERHSGFARRVLWDERDHPRSAPALMLWEFANVMWKKRVRGEIEDRHFEEASEFLVALEVDFADPIDVRRTVTLGRLAMQTGLNAYDAAYLDLAVSHNAALATTDRDLTGAAVAAGLVVHSPFA